ncbi:RNA-binding protein [Candidatus Bathyarchaeota archaeon]|nr:MAG: RNA-binding protein [Candidatus Bathyarchaeota archaeon]
MAVFETAVKRHFLKEKAARQLLLELSQKFKIDTEQLFGSKPHIELAETEIAEILLINRKPLFARVDKNILPTLFSNKVSSLLPKIVVDMGAVPHVCNGADLMVPGVVQISADFKKNDLILIVDERHGKPLAIGVALFDSHAMRKMKRGKIVKNIHYVGDKLWKTLKKLMG